MLPHLLDPVGYIKQGHTTLGHPPYLRPFRLTPPDRLRPASDDLAGRVQLTGLQCLGERGQILPLLKSKGVPLAQARHAGEMGRQPQFSFNVVGQVNVGFAGADRTAQPLGERVNPVAVRFVGTGQVD